MVVTSQVRSTCIKAVSDLVRVFRQVGECRPTCISVIRDSVLVGDSDGAISEYEVFTGRKERVLTLGLECGSVNCMITAFGFIWAGHEDHTIRQWQLSSGELFRTMRGHQGPVLSLCILDQCLFSGSQDGFVFQWDLLSGEGVNWMPMTRSVTTLTAWADGRYAIAGDPNGRAVYWDYWSRKTPFMAKEIYAKMQTGKDGRTQIAACHCAAIWAPWIFSGVGDSLVEQRELQDGKLVRSLEHPGRVNAVTTSLAVLFTGCEDGVLRSWDLKTGHLLQKFDHNGGGNQTKGVPVPIVAIACHPNNETLSVHDYSATLPVIRPGTMTSTHYIMTVYADGRGCQWKMASRLACRKMAEYLFENSRVSSSLPLIPGINQSSTGSSRVLTRRRRQRRGVLSGYESKSANTGPPERITAGQAKSQADLESKEAAMKTLAYNSQKVLSGFMHGISGDFLCRPPQKPFGGMQKTIEEHALLYKKIKSGWQAALKEQKAQNKQREALIQMGMQKFDPTEPAIDRKGQPILMGALTEGSRMWARPALPEDHPGFNHTI